MCALSKKNEKAKEKVGVTNSPVIHAGQVAQVRVRHALAPIVIAHYSTMYDAST